MHAGRQYLLGDELSPVPYRHGDSCDVYIVFGRDRAPIDRDRAALLRNIVNIEMALSVADQKLFFGIAAPDIR